MANRRRATTSEAQDQVAAQRPDPVSNVAPPPPPEETPSPPSANPVTQDQFASLVQQVQALTQMVQGSRGVLRPSVPAPHPVEEAAAPCPPAISSTGPHGVADPPYHPKEAEPIPQEARGRADPPKFRRARSPSPVSSRRDSTPSPRPRPPAPPSAPENEILQRIQEMRLELDATKRAHPLQQKEDHGIPFSKKIMEEVIPSHVKLPTIESYYGSSDPDDHLSSFRSIMMFHGASDAILCRAFPSTLRGSARTWFNSLKPGSVSSFDELSRLFIGQFVSSRRHRRRSDSLSEVKQKEGEPLKKYLGRFNAAMLEVDHLNHEVAMSALAGGILKESDFYLALEVNYPSNLSEMMALADKYARVEDSRRVARAESSERKERKGADRHRPAHRPSPPRRQKVPPPPPRNRTRSPPRRFNRYTPLNAPRTQILMEIERQLPRPLPLRGNLARRDMSKYCRYHRENGHDTEDCWQLRNEIERLIQRGRLSHFRGAPEPRDGGNRQPEPQQPPPPNTPAVGHINMVEIVGGPSGGRNNVIGSTPKKARTDELSPFLERIFSVPRQGRAPSAQDGPIRPG